MPLAGDLAEVVGDREHWRLVDYVSAVFERPGAGWRGVVRCLHARQTVRRPWHAAIISNGTAQDSTATREPHDAVRWIEAHH